MGTDHLFAQLLWTGGLAATPLAVAVAVLCRCRGVRPATRHVLWVAVLASFLTPAIGSALWRPHWFRSDRLIAAADLMLVEPGAGQTDLPMLAPRPTADATTSEPPALGSATAPVRPVSQSCGAPATREADCELALPRAACDPVRASDARDSDPGESPSAVVGTGLPVEAALVPAVATDPTTMPATTIRAEGPAGSGRGLRDWFVQLLTVRDALADLPPLPLSLWFAGAAIVVLLGVWRRCSCLSWIRRATPADPRVQAVVRQVGETLGLTRVPRVVFVEAAISPMIWCGLRPLLVLPTPLWSTLDEDSRRAVLVHELAHVRRWDHVLCWLEAVVGAVYWWHPVVWWARRRMHAEAEASCDVWVTALFPSARRAYASALVVTKSYVSSRGAGRGPWLGVTSGSMKRLARRITMVMTHNAAPRASVFGLLMAAMVMVTGTFVMPGLACPPEDEAKAKASHPKVYVGTTVATPVVATPTAEASDGGVVFFGEAPALEAMRGKMQVAPTPATPQASPFTTVAPRAAKTPKPPKPAQAPKAPQPPQPPMTVFSTPAGAQPSQPGVDLEALKAGRTPRDYRLSDGKLGAFYSMMSRDDVPILVQLDDHHITIWGTEDEHAVFSGFIKIVDGNSQNPLTVAMGMGGRRNPTLTMNGLSPLQGVRAGNVAAAAGAEKAASEAYRSSLRAWTVDRDAAEKARAESEAARTLSREARDRSVELSKAQREELEQAAETLRSRSEALQKLQVISKTTEQRVRDLERQLQQIEERARKLEQQLEEAQDRKPEKTRRSSSFAPGVLSTGAEWLSRGLFDHSNETAGEVAAEGAVGR